MARAAAVFSDGALPYGRTTTRDLPPGTAPPSPGLMGNEPRGPASPSAVLMVNEPSGPTRPEPSRPKMPPPTAFGTSTTSAPPFTRSPAGPTRWPDTACVDEP